MENRPVTTLPALCVLPASRLLAEWEQGGATIQQQESKKSFRNLQPGWLLNDCNLPFLPFDRCGRGAIRKQNIPVTGRMP